MMKTEAKNQGRIRPAAPVGPPEHPEEETKGKSTRLTRRRSARLLLQIPLTVEIATSLGQNLSQSTETIDVGKHGGLIHLRQPVQAGIVLNIRLQDQGRAARAKVVRKYPSCDGRGANVAFEILGDPEFWGLDFPPDGGWLDRSSCELRTSHSQGPLVGGKTTSGSLAAGASRSAPLFLPNDVVGGRYRIARFLGRGGMGEVYAADDIELSERVALKVLVRSVAANPQVLGCLKQEIHLARKVTHPNVCRTLEFGYHKSVTPAGVGTKTPYLTMEFLHGETLARRLARQGRLPTQQALPLVTQIAAALAAAHRAGVVHRDLKPSNVMLVLCEDGEHRAVVTDFGLAARASGYESVVDLSSEASEVSGTWAYMAPEQLLGKQSTPAADLYALGVLMFEMLTGTLPFEAETPLAAAFKRLQEPPPSPRARLPELSPRWEAAILRCLEPDPADRFRSAVALLKLLRREEPMAEGRASRRRTMPSFCLAA
jgi:hypothetical protein